MAIAKVILNGETLMDVTSDTATANNMLSGIQATKNDGTKVTGNIASKSSTDLSVSGATVTAPAGYYANAASKAVATTTHPSPTASIASSTGVVTASHTQETGYVTGGTTTGTLSLTTQAGKTVTPTETAQTAVASYRWTTGPVSVAAISSTYVGSGIPTRSAADMTVAAQSVTAPAGYYSQAFTKAVTVTTHPNPTAAITSSTGVVTATHAQTAGYVAAGTTTGTTQLASKAAATYNTSTADQTIGSYQWLTGTQTIKSVTTSNLTAENIAEGVTVKVGDANNASRITQVTGTHSGATSYTATISGTGGNGPSLCYVQHNNETTKYYTNGDTIIFKEGDTFTFTADKYPSGGGSIYLNDQLVATETGNTVKYTWTASVGNINIILSASSGSIQINTLIIPTGVTPLSSAGTHNVYVYSQATIAEGSAFPPAVTITTNPTFSMNSSTGVITASYTGSSSVTPTVTSGWVSQGTAGTISTTGTSTYRLTTQAAQTITPGSTTQTIASNRWLTGTQTIAGDSNLKAENIAEGVSIFGVEGTHSVAGEGFTADQIAMRTIAGSISGNATIIGSYAFYQCSALTSATFSVATTIFTNAFYQCSALTSVTFPSVTTISSGAFYQCKTLTAVSFPAVSYISSYAFTYCYNLLSFYLLGSSIPTLTNSNTFNSTPISNYTTSTGGVYGSIFVPASLYSSYLTATNWSLYSSRFVSVQGG